MRRCGDCSWHRSGHPRLTGVPEIDASVHHWRSSTGVRCVDQVPPGAVRTARRGVRALPRPESTTPRRISATPQLPSTATARYGRLPKSRRPSRRQRPKPRLPQLTRSRPDGQAKAALGTLGGDTEASGRAFRGAGQADSSTASPTRSTSSPTPSGIASAELARHPIRAPGHPAAPIHRPAARGPPEPGHLPAARGPPAVGHRPAAPGRRAATDTEISAGRPRRVA